MPASGMLWSNGTIEGTSPSIEVGYHQSFDILKEKSLSLNPMSSIIFSISERHLNSFTIIKIINRYFVGLEAIYKQKLMLRLGQNSFINWLEE